MLKEIKAVWALESLHVVIVNTVYKCILFFPLANYVTHYFNISPFPIIFKHLFCFIENEQLVLYTDK